MTDVTYHSGGLRPLDGCITDDFPVAATLGINDAVFIDPALPVVDGKGQIKKTAGASSKCIGLAYAIENKGAIAAVGQKVGAILFGRVAGFTGLVPGAVLFLSANAGKLATTGSVAVAYAESDTIAFFMPVVTNAAS